MPSYPRACPRCKTVTAESGFAIDRGKVSGRKSVCKTCDSRRARSYYKEHAAALFAEREAARKAAHQAELAALAAEQEKRVEAAKKQQEAQSRRQKEFLRSIGVPDLSPEEVTERARRRAQERRPLESGPNFG